MARKRPPSAGCWSGRGWRPASTSCPATPRSTATKACCGRRRRPPSSPRRPPRNLAALRARIRALHSYDLPAILALPAVDGDAGFLDWVRAGVAAAQPKP
ncbi:divalent cation tolerance protein CutA [Dankookia sp. P2]|uniref:divalent cation tolerance protein CutA n=1 Tax=Dankookia sp. P2 TaxID=3423955 RepID=UPI003D665ECC